MAVSLTGALMPGPVTAATINQGAKRREAGALMALGHGMVELPVIALIYFGVAEFLTDPWVRISVGLAGGLALGMMAIQMLNTRSSQFNDTKAAPRGCVITGITLTAANPYFLFWWATVGATLMVNARDFGLAGVAAFGLAHWFCDLSWLSAISLAVFKSRKIWTKTAHSITQWVCAATLAGFGAWFIFSSFDLMRSV